jgi:hypothetical protein
MPRVRDFRPANMAAFASPKIRVPFSPGSGFIGRVWQFDIFVPAGCSRRLGGRRSAPRVPEDHQLRGLRWARFEGQCLLGAA